MSEENRKVDYRKVFSEIGKRKKIYIIVLPIVFVLSCIYIFSIPRTYTSEAEIALETESASSSKSLGTLGTLASTFGLDMSSLKSSDAITPMLYPDLLKDNGFITSLFSIQIATKDGALKTDYFSYMKSYQKGAWWADAISSAIKLLTSNEASGGNGQLDPYNPSKDVDEIIKSIRSSITLTVDKKTGAITVSAASQDPMVSKILADSICGRLQVYITDYRTRKARQDCEYFNKLMDEAKAKYLKAQQEYAGYSDTNMDAILQSVSSHRDQLENEMQLQYNAYTQMAAQAKAAEAKVQERTPVFMKVKGASVEMKPTSPKRVIFVLVMEILAFICVTIYVLRKIILPESNIQEAKKDE